MTDHEDRFRQAALEFLDKTEVPATDPLAAFLTDVVVPFIRGADPGNRPWRPFRPRVVTLCGSTRFRALHEEAAIQETVRGHIVLTAPVSLRLPAHERSALVAGFPEDLSLEDVKARLDELHLRKIDMSDEILVLNQDGYIGEPTHREIRYAAFHGKEIRYWEQWHGGQPVADGITHPDRAVRDVARRDQPVDNITPGKDMV
jgi:hypothetical protein